MNKVDKSNSPKPLSIKKNLSSLMMYRKVIKNNNIIKNSFDNQFYSNNNYYNLGNDFLSNKNSTENIYIPAKNRCNNYNYNYAHSACSPC